MSHLYGVRVFNQSEERSCISTLPIHKMPFSLTFALKKSGPAFVFASPVSMISTFLASCGF